MKERIIMIVIITMLLVGCTEAKDTNLTKAVKEIETLQYQEALQTLEKAKESKEDEKQIYRTQGIAYMGLTQYEPAMEAFGLALAESSGIPKTVDYDINYYLGVCFYKLGRLEEAEKVYSAILSLQEKENRAYFMRGKVRLETDKKKEAVADFEQALLLAPKDYEQLIDIYQTFAGNGLEEEGKAYLSKALNDKNQTMTEVEKGMIYYYLGDFENARNSLEKGRESGTEEAILLLGKTYEALNDYNYASSVYAQFVEKNPQSYMIYNQLALCKMKMNDYQGALDAIQTAIQVEGNSILQTMKYNEIVAYEYLGDFKKAAVLMEAYRSTYPDDEKANREYEFLKTR